MIPKGAECYLFTVDSVEAADILNKKIKYIIDIFSLIVGGSLVITLRNGIIMSPITATTIPTTQ